MDLSNLIGKDSKCMSGPMGCLLMMFLLLYILSPIDFLPEMLLGPFGLIDDAGAGLFLLFMIFQQTGMLEKMGGNGMFGGFLNGKK